MQNVTWLKKQIYLILFLSFLHWVPIAIISLISLSLLPKLFAVIFLMSTFVTPITSLLYIGICLWLIIKKRGDYLLSSIIIISNSIYLIWGIKYIITYFARF